MFANHKIERNKFVGLKYHFTKDMAKVKFVKFIFSMKNSLKYSVLREIYVILKLKRLRNF